MCACQVASLVSDSLWPVDCNPPGSFVGGILQARILEWVTTPFSRGSSKLRYGILWLLWLLHRRQILYQFTHRKSPLNVNRVTEIYLSDIQWFLCVSYLLLELSLSLYLKADKVLTWAIITIFIKEGKEKGKWLWLPQGCIPNSAGKSHRVNIFTGEYGLK